MRTKQPAGSFPDPPSKDIVLQLVTRASGRGYLDLGFSRGEVTARCGNLAIAPAGFSCYYELAEPFELLMLALPFARARDVLDEASQGALRDFGAIHRCDMPSDPVLASIMTRLWAEAAGQQPMGPLYAEDAAVAISSRLTHLEMEACGITTSAEYAWPLHGARLARVLSFIEDDLAGGLSQADLAHVAGLSPWHFCRAFKAATGVAPHRYVMLRRLARAQWMLRATSLGISEIAMACGFASHAHLTSVFKSQVGIGPLQWRKTLA